MNPAALRATAAAVTDHVDMLAPILAYIIFLAGCAALCGRW